MIITDEELMALLESDDSQEPTFYPVSVYALDAVSHQAVKGRACRPMPICTAPDPMPAGNGKGCLPPGPSPCLILPLIRGPTICLICWLPGRGSIASAIPGSRGCRHGSRGGVPGSPSARSCCSKITPSREPAFSRRSRDWGCPATGFRMAKGASRRWKRGREIAYL